MPLAIWQRNITTDAGDIVPGATIEVRREVPGAPLVQLYSDRDGLVSIGNPFTADANGFAAFHVEGGAYKITATATIAGEDFEKIWRYVPIGNLQEYDFGQAGLLTFEWSAVVADLSSRDAHDDAADGFSVLVEADSSNSNLPTAYYKLSASSADWSAGFTFPAIRMKAAVSLTLDARGQPIATGVAADQPVPFACVITGYQIIGDGTGGIVLDVWADEFANYPPTDADSITDAAPIALSGALIAEDYTLSGWSKTLAEGDVLRFNVDSNAGELTKITVTLFLDRI